jgi:hypothetical protein
MPLHKGKSKRVISENIEEMVHSAKRKGKIGNVPTPTAAKAVKVAAAIAYKKAGRSRKG